MPRGYRNLILAALGYLILGNAKQHERHDKQDQHQQAPAKPPTVPKPPDPKPTEKAKEQCYPGSEVGVSCDGIAAKAAVDQARDTDKQTSSSNWQIGVGVGTLLAAIFAAIFAWLAAIHTKRGADAANDANRAWLNLNVVLAPGDFVWNGNDCSVSIAVGSFNQGQSPGRGVAFLADFYCGKDIVKEIERFSERLRKGVRFLKPVNVFPNSSYTYTMDYTFNRHGNPVEIGDLVAPLLIAGVAYRTTVDGVADQMRITVRAYDLSHNGNAIRKADCPVPVAQLTLNDSVFHPGFVE